MPPVRQDHLRRSTSPVSLQLEDQIKSVQAAIHQLFAAAAEEGIPKSHIAERLGLTREIGRGDNSWNLWLSQRARAEKLRPGQFRAFVKNVAAPEYRIWKDTTPLEDQRVTLQGYQDRAIQRRTQEQQSSNSSSHPKAVQRRFKQLRDAMEHLYAYHGQKCIMISMKADVANDDGADVITTGDAWHHWAQSLGGVAQAEHHLTMLASSNDIQITHCAVEESQDPSAFTTARVRTMLGSHLRALIEKRLPHAMHSLNQGSRHPATLPWRSLLLALRREFNMCFTGWPPAAYPHIIRQDGSKQWVREEKDATGPDACGIQAPASWKAEAACEVIPAVRRGEFALRFLATTESNVSSDPNTSPLAAPSNTHPSTSAALPNPSPLAFNAPNNLAPAMTQGLQAEAYWTPSSSFALSQ